MKSFLFIICLTTCFCAASQNLEFENFTTKNGLLSDDVYKIYQDKQGYIWFFTNYGAMKYNGNKFEQVLKNLPFDESFIYSYYESSKGKKWVANSKGKIFEIIGDSAVQILGIEELSSHLKSKVAEINQLCVDEKENIYLNTKFGSYKVVRNENNKWYNLDDRHKNDTAFVFLQDIDQTLFAGLSFFYSRLLYNKYRPLFFKIKYTDSKYVSKTFNILFKKEHHYNPFNFVKSDENIYFSFNNRVYKIGNSGRISELEINGFVLNLCLDSKRQLWIATLNNGLFVYDANGEFIAHYFEGRTVNHVLADTQNGLWVTTEGFGIFHCKNIDEMHFSTSEPLGNSINFLKKIDNQLFIGTSNGEIDVVHSNKKEFLKIPAWKRLYVLDIIKYKNFYLTCNNTTNLNLLNINGKIEIGALPFIKPPFSPVLMYKLEGDSILCLARRTILILSHGLKDIENEKNNKILWFEKRIFCFEQRGNEKMIGTEDGVYFFSGENISRPKYLLATKNSKIGTIVKDNDENYWFCSKGNGLFKLTTSNQLINYSMHQNLPSNIVNNISFTPKNEVLLSTNNGLFYSKTSDLKEWSELFSGQVMSAEVLGNKIYCGTKKGLVVIEKKTETSDRKIYFNLATIKVNNEELRHRDLLKLRYDENNIQFNFDAISFSKNFYNIRYQLHGPQNYYGISSNHQVNFQKLEPGEYQLRATLLDNNRSINAIYVYFDIVPAFWQKLWFKLLYGILLLLFLILTVWLLFKSYKRKIEKKNEVERLILEYKLIALKAQINPHFMSNCLTAIQHLIMSNKVDQANLYIVKFSRLVRQVLNFSSKALVSLNEEIELAELNVALEQLRFDNKFVLNIIKDESLIGDKIYLPPLIIQPIIENAIWHGLLPLKNLRQGKLIIKAETNQDSLILSIEDNGVGRFRNTQSIMGLRDSKGVAITKQRIKNLNNRYDFAKADLIYEDLKDSNNEPCGTKVVLILPLNLKPDKDE